MFATENRVVTSLPAEESPSAGPVSTVMRSSGAVGVLRRRANSMTRLVASCVLGAVAPFRLRVARCT